jgi:glycosyltransferase involved in cell wall biosynthesis
MKISVIFPTRKRIKAVKEVIESIEQTCDNFDNVEICIYHDIDDIETKEFLDDLSKTYKNLKYTTTSDNINLSEMWNYAYSTLATGDIIMLCADDVRFRTKSWDTTVINVFNHFDDKLVLVYGNDGIQGENLATLPFVHRKWIEVSKFWLPPYFVSDYVDLWLYEVASALGRKIYLNDVYTEHMHFSVNKSPKDETAQNRLDRHQKENPGRIYNEKTQERIAHIELLQSYINAFHE